MNININGAVLNDEMIGHVRYLQQEDDGGVSETFDEAIRIIASDSQGDLPSDLRAERMRLITELCYMKKHILSFKKIQQTNL